jgi:hypothetical protein
MFERQGKQYPHPSSSGPRVVAPCRPTTCSKILNWQWNLFYCCVHLYLLHLLLLCKHDFLHKNNVLTPQHTARVGQNDSNQCTRNGQFRRPTLFSRNLGHSKMQPYPLILQNIETQLRPKKNITSLVTNNCGYYLYLVPCFTMGLHSDMFLAVNI